MEEARLLAYDEGDNYVVYNVRTKKIERSRNDRHIPIDFLRPHLENPFNIRSTSPPLLRSKMIPRIKRGLRMLSTRRIPRSLKKILRGQMMKWRAVLAGVCVEQRVDTGAHFEAGGRGVLVEPQPVSRQVVNMDIPLETTIDLSQEDLCKMTSIMINHHYSMVK
ncbi:hypothetical protein PDIDSM_1691 [Penicillium digitatum]|nr:hypothetical protein PDIDSM_1691 [Penicillium digitatum]